MLIREGPLYFNEIRERANGDISSSYQSVGAALTFPLRVFVIWNNTDQIMRFSFDGSTDHIILDSGGEMTIDASTNKALLPQKTLFVKHDGAAPASGSVYFMTARGDDS